jgi:hypothetical protein
MLILTSVAVAVFLCWMVGRTVQAFREGRELVTPGVRPPLATMICFWEFLAPVLWLYDRFYFPHAYHSAHIAPAPADPVAAGSQILQSVLSVAAGVALWRMMRLAYPLFAVKFVLSYAAWIFLLQRHTRPPIPRLGMRIAVDVLEVAVFALSAAVVWYVHDITKLEPIYGD